MKKRLYYFIIAIVSISIMTTIPACKKAAIVKENSLKVIDFEAYEETAKCKFNNLFGKVTFNTDKQFITSGSKSAKLEIYGDPTFINMNVNESIYDPYIKIYADSTSFTKVDYSDVIAFRLDAYNSSEKDLKINMAIESESASGTPYSFFLGEQVLKKGQWNNLEFKLNREKYSVAQKITNTTSIKIIFEGRKSLEEKAFLVYLDNVRAIKQFVPMKQITKVSTTKNEVLDFEDLYDLPAVQPMGAECEYKAYPKLTLNTDVNFVTSGRKSLKAETVKSPIKHFYYEGWVGFRLWRDNLKHVNFLNYNTKTAAFSFDVMNESDHQVRLFCIFDDTTRKSHSVFWDLVPNSAQTMTIPFKDIVASFVDLGKLKSISFSFQERFDSGTVMYFDKLNITEQEKK